MRIDFGLSLVAVVLMSACSTAPPARNARTAAIDAQIAANNAQIAELQASIAASEAQAKVKLDAGIPEYNAAVARLEAAKTKEEYVPAYTDLMKRIDDLEDNWSIVFGDSNNTFTNSRKKYERELELKKLEWSLEK